jgi:hypothetical protein
MARDDYRRDLGEGLTLRWSTPDDVERVVALDAQVFRPSADAPPNWHLPLWVRDMFSGRHPHIGPRDFALVEDARSGAAVASACLLGYDVTYEGIPLRFGRPEAVATSAEYRRRGLVRAIFELLHARSVARGELVQGITGIPNFYRQFDYEFAALLDDGVTVYFPAIPALKAGEPEPYTLREATPDDVALLGRLWTRAWADTALSSVVTDDYWRWAMAGMHPDSPERWHAYVIVEAGGPAAGRPVGALTIHQGRGGAAVPVMGPVVDAGVPLVRVVPPVLRGVRALADITRPIRPETPAAGAIRLSWGGQALYDVLGATLAAEPPPYPYAWYLRVPDLPRFLRHVAPALERRLAESPQAGYAGDLTIDLYRGGLRFVFDAGRLATVEDWRRPPR